MRVIDARKANRLTKEIEVKDEVMEHAEEWRDDEWALFCVRMDGKFVGCAQRRNGDGTRGMPMLCAEWTQARYFERWAAKYCSDPYRFDEKDDETIRRVVERALELSEGMTTADALHAAVREERAAGTFITNGVLREIQGASGREFLKRWQDKE